MSSSEPPLTIYRTRDLEAVVAASPLIRRRRRDGSLFKLRRGAYASTAEWNGLDKDAQYLALIHATVGELGEDAVLCHESAGAAWGLPVIGPWPTEIHLLVDRASGGRSDPGIRRHALGVDSEGTTTVGGLRVTSLARTVVDLAASARLFSAVATTDAALHVPRYGTSAMLTKDELYAELNRRAPFRGSSRARRVIDFAEAGSGSTSESASRTSIALLGFPEPELQRVYVVDGREVAVDFYFRDVDGIGECDGMEKYTSPELRAGKTIEQVLLDEKSREDALRRQSKGFQRWGSREAMSPALLRVKLLELGLRQGRPRLRGR